MAAAALTPLVRAPFHAVPTIDFTAFRQGSLEERRAVAERIGRACREVGVFNLTGHGVAEELVAGVFREIDRFCALPESDKQALHMRRSPHFRGYFGAYDEKTENGSPGDLKEGLEIGTEPDGRALPDLPTRLLGPNQWPAGLPGFRPTVEAFFQALIGLSTELLRAFGESFGLAPDTFTRSLRTPISRLKLLRYPEQAAADEGALLGCGAHTDYSVLTIVAQDGVGGLELQNSAGAWIPVPPVEGALFVNLGEQMARWTNDVFLATPHRVVNRTGRPRRSAAFFFHPDPGTVIDPLPACCTADNPRRYPPITAAEHLLELFSDPTSSYRGQAAAT